MKKLRTKRIAAQLRNWLLIVFVIAVLVSTAILSVLGRSMAIRSSDAILKLNITDVKDDIRDASDANIYAVGTSVVYDYQQMMKFKDEPLKDTLELFDYFEIKEKDYETALLQYLRICYNISEINVVDDRGIIRASTKPEFVGFDMASGEQSAEFLCLLEGTPYYVQKYMPISFDSSISMKYAGIALDEGGFIQVAYDAAEFQDDIDRRVYGATKNRHVGQTGFIIIVNEEGGVVSSPKHEMNGKNITEYGVSLDTIRSRAEDTPYEILIHDEKYNCIVSRIEGYFLFAMVPLDETMSMFTKVTVVMDILSALSFILVLVLVYQWTKHLVVDNIDKVTDSLNKISGGDLDVSVDAGGSEEFESLSKNINSTVEALRLSAEKEVERINQELEYAKSIQRSALPMLFPPFPDRTDFEIYASMDPAKEVGGDLFDFELINGRLGFCIADVSGKGIPAALMMMRAKTLIRSYGTAGLSPEMVLTNVNQELSTNNETGMFVTCWLGFLDTDTGHVEYTNAGHNPPLVRHAGGEFEYLQSKPGLVLGGMEGIKYRRGEFYLKPGDDIFLYTDGVTEATNEKLELYGEARLKKLLDSISCMDCESKCKILWDDIGVFVGNAPQFDDITMLSLRYLGAENSLTVEATLDEYAGIVEFVEKALDDFECPEPVKMKIDVAVDEILANVISYAYGEGRGTVTVKTERGEDGSGAVITFIDYGIPFNPLEAEEPDVTLSVEERHVGKLGIFMVKKLMDKVEYEYNDANVLKITKYF